MIIESSKNIRMVVHRSKDMSAGQWQEFRHFQDSPHPSRDLSWLNVLHQGFGHRTFLLEARDGEDTIGILPLAEVTSLLFGRFLVGLPYLNTGGVWTKDPRAVRPLIDQAVQLADELNVRYLELRHEAEYSHPKLRDQLTTKALMRLSLPSTADELWDQFKSKLRNQIRNGERNQFAVRFGGTELLDDFYKVFSRNMRDLGTPVYGKRFFQNILEQFSDSAELCCVSLQSQPVAAALLIHGNETTEVPSASSLREFNSTNANMCMYWQLLKRAIERGNQVFDFGRSTIDSNTYRFKKQWGAKPAPSVWQYYVRKGKFDALRPESGNYSLAIDTWRRLPVALTQWIGPMIVRGIP